MEHRDSADVSASGSPSDFGARSLIGSAHWRKRLDFNQAIQLASAKARSLRLGLEQAMRKIGLHYLLITVLVPMSSPDNL
jgi:hypothetical protein